MSISKKTFIKKYSDAIIRDEAAVFAGAGYSKEAGFCNWKELLKDVAEDLNLSIEKESDYISLAQYYENKNGYNILCNTILDRFSKYKNNYTIAKVIESLPIKTYWTTNFDHFIEDTLKYDFNKNVDVKKSNMNLTCNLRNRDATVYKFHGDIDDFSSLVITKSDYEEFENKSLPFINALNGDLISKTFVFVGYSFNDPDLFNVLKNVHLTYDKNKRIHYALIKRVSENDYNDKDEYNYELIKYKLKIQDLKRYGIETVEIDDFKEIVEIFINIKKRYLINNIYIAGSCRKLPNNWTQTSADMFLYNLGYKLAKENFKICTGCIEGVGPQIENGVLKSYMCDRYYGKLLGMESTGSGRRQNYTYAPVSRMTNTCLAEGSDDEEEMIRGVNNGLFVESIGGGFGGMQFSLEVKEGFLIKNGQIDYDHQVKNIMLTGNGIDVIKRIDRVGKKIKYEKGGFCGASSGLIPTTTPQPMVRISHMSIG